VPAASVAPGQLLKSRGEQISLIGLLLGASLLRIALTISLTTQQPPEGVEGLVRKENKRSSAIPHPAELAFREGDEFKLRISSPLLSSGPPPQRAVPASSCEVLKWQATEAAELARDAHLRP